MTKLVQCLRDELVRRDYAAPAIRSYVQIIDAFRQHTARASIGSRQRSFGAITYICSKSDNSLWGPSLPRSAHSGSSAAMC